MTNNDVKTRALVLQSEPSASWNKGKAVGQMLPLTREELTLLRALLEKDRKIRDLALLNTGIDTMLRASDLLPLTVEDVRDHLGNIREELTIRQKKTQVGHVVALSPATRSALTKWIEGSGKGSADYLWTSVAHRQTGRPLTRESYATLVKTWCQMIGLDGRRYSTHSIRRSKSTAIYTITQNLKACQILLGHKSIASTALYLSSEQCKALELAKGMEL